MKFLIFNLTVAAALVYLLTTDRGEFQRVAGNLHDAASGIRTMTVRAVGNGRKLLDRTVSGPSHGGENAPSQAPRPAVAPPPPPPPLPASPAPRVEMKTTTAAQPPGKGPAVADQPMIDPAAIDPRVAQRRDEVFAGIAPNPPVTRLPQEPKGPALKEGAPMMTPAQRRKELYSLAEEMELLYARTVSN